MNPSQELYKPLFTGERGFLEDLATRNFFTTKIGFGAGISSTGAYNTFIGYQSGAKNKQGYQNVYIGYQAGTHALSSYRNVFIGASAGRNTTVGFHNVFIGTLAGEHNTVGAENVFLGLYAGQQNLVGSANVFLGSHAGAKNTQGNYNTVIGGFAGQNNRNGERNTFVGFYAGNTNLFGSDNTFIGTEAGRYNENGASNIFIGPRAGLNHRNGFYNIFLGTNTGAQAGMASNNVLVGNEVASQRAVGSSNVIIGNETAPLLTGSENTLVGYRVAPLLESGSKNVLVGTGILLKSPMTTGSVVLSSEDTSVADSSVVIGNRILSQQEKNVLVGFDLYTDAANTITMGTGVRIESVNLFKDPLSTLFEASSRSEGERKYAITGIDYGLTLRPIYAVLGLPTSNIYRSSEIPDGDLSPPTFNLLTYFPYFCIVHGKAIYISAQNQLQLQIQNDFIQHNLPLEFTENNHFYVTGSTSNFNITPGTTAVAWQLPLLPTAMHNMIRFGDSNISIEVLLIRKSKQFEFPISIIALAPSSPYTLPAFLYTGDGLIAENTSIVSSQPPSYGYIIINGSNIEYRHYRDLVRVPTDSFILDGIAMFNGVWQKKSHNSLTIDVPASVYPVAVSEKLAEAGAGTVFLLSGDIVSSNVSMVSIPPSTEVIKNGVTFTSNMVAWETEYSLTSYGQNEYKTRYDELITEGIRILNIICFTEFQTLENATKTYYETYNVSIQAYPFKTLLETVIGLLSTNRPFFTEYNAMIGQYSSTLNQSNDNRPPRSNFVLAFNNVRTILDNNQIRIIVGVLLDFIQPPYPLETGQAIYQSNFDRLQLQISNYQTFNNQNYINYRTLLQSFQTYTQYMLRFYLFPRLGHIMNANLRMLQATAQILTTNGTLDIITGSNPILGPPQTFEVNILPHPPSPPEIIAYPLLGRVVNGTYYLDDIQPMVPYDRVEYSFTSNQRVQIWKIEVRFQFQPIIHDYPIYPNYLQNRVRLDPSHIFFGPGTTFEFLNIPVQCTQEDIQRGTVFLPMGGSFYRSFKFKTSHSPIDEHTIEARLLNFAGNPINKQLSLQLNYPERKQCTTLFTENPMGATSIHVIYTSNCVILSGPTVVTTVAISQIGQHDLYVHRLTTHASVHYCYAFTDGTISAPYQTSLICTMFHSQPLVMNMGIWGRPFQPSFPIYHPLANSLIASFTSNASTDTITGVLVDPSSQQLVYQHTVPVTRVRTFELPFYRPQSSWLEVRGTLPLDEPYVVAVGPFWQELSALYTEQSIIPKEDIYLSILSSPSNIGFFERGGKRTHVVSLADLETSNIYFRFYETREPSVSLQSHIHVYGYHTSTFALSILIKTEFIQDDPYSFPPYISLPSVPSRSFDVVLDQADSFVITDHLSDLGLSPSLQFYLVKTPLYGLVIDLNTRRQVTRYHVIDSHVVYQHFGNSTGPDSFQFQLASTPFDLWDTIFEFRITIRRRNRLTGNKNLNSYFQTRQEALGALNPLRDAFQFQYPTDSSSRIHILSSCNITLPTQVFPITQDINYSFTEPLGESTGLQFTVNQFGSSVPYVNRIAAFHPSYHKAFVYSWEAFLNRFEDRNQITNASFSDYKSIAYTFHPDNFLPLILNRIVKFDVKARPVYPFAYPVGTLPYQETKVFYTYRFEWRFFNHQLMCQITITHNRISITDGTGAILFSLATPVPVLNNLAFSLIQVIPRDPENDNGLTLSINNVNYLKGEGVPAISVEQLQAVHIIVDPLAPENLLLLGTSNVTRLPQNGDLPFNFVFENSHTEILLRDFSISSSAFRDEDALDYIENNIALGKSITIRGLNNICIGKNFITSGANSIIVGHDIGTDSSQTIQVNDIYQSLVIGSSSFQNSIIRDTISIGYDNLNDLVQYNQDQVAEFFSNRPIIIGNNISGRTLDFYINIANTFLKTKVGGSQIYIGLEEEQVVIGETANKAFGDRPAKLLVKGAVKAEKYIEPISIIYGIMESPSFEMHHVVRAQSYDYQARVHRVVYTSVEGDASVIGITHGLLPGGRIEIAIGGVVDAWVTGVVSIGDPLAPSGRQGGYLQRAPSGVHTSFRALSPFDPDSPEQGQSTKIIDGQVMGLILCHLK